RRSSSSTCCVVESICVVTLSLGSTGNGVLARRLASVLPPPSRFAWARISALVGFDVLLALTSATSRGGRLRSNVDRLNGLNLIASTNAWSKIEPAIVAVGKRLLARPGVTMNGSDMVRVSGTGTAGAKYGGAGSLAAVARSTANFRGCAGIRGMWAPVYPRTALRPQDRPAARWLRQRSTRPA